MAKRKLFEKKAVQAEMPKAARPKGSSSDLIQKAKTDIKSHSKFDKFKGVK